MKKFASIGLALAIGFGGALTMAAPSTASTVPEPIQVSQMASGSVKMNQTVKNNWNAGWKTQGCGGVLLKVSKPFSSTGQLRYSQGLNYSQSIVLQTNSQSHLYNKTTMKKAGAQACYYHLVYKAYGVKTGTSLKNADKALLKKFNSRTLKNSYSTRGKGVEKAVLCMGKARGVASFSYVSGSCTKAEIYSAKKLLSGKRA